MIPYPSFQNFYEIKSPWFSSLYQGLIASCFIRAYLLTNDIKYITLANKSIQFVLNYNGPQKLIKKIENIHITQEYPGDKVPNVLNGHLSFLIGALETNKYLKLVHKKKNSLNNFLKPLKKFLLLCSKNNWTIYNYNFQKNHNFSTTNYHNLHISQLKYISILTNSEYDDIINDWLKVEKFKNKTFAMFQKIIYKIYNE